MSADLLRRAAEKLRDTAASCEQGDWTAEVGDTGTAWVNLPAYPHAWGMHGFAEEARYVALVGAPVGLAIAAWLEETARQIKSYAVAFTEGKERFDDLTEVDEAAHKLARAILREGS